MMIFLNSCEAKTFNLETDTISIVDNEQVWYISEFPNSCPSCVWPHKITFGKDTIINSLVYKEILDFRGEEYESESKAYSLGYLYETTDKKVYWNVSLFGHPSADILIYDFNAQINDTIYNYWIVTNIDSVNILGTKRKRIELRNCDSKQNYWIEGIGDLSDLLAYPSLAICDFKSNIVGYKQGASGFKLNCVEKGSNIIYKNSENNNCWFYKGYDK